ncbi:MAG: DUF4331 domain-containing protein [Chloroflexi bacterium]|nr:DUF4331 domain-containing protein [Chloroflexota bacterium]
MKQKHFIRLPRTATNLVTAGLAFALLASSAFIGMGTNPSAASSHREAPLISRDPYADNTDTYAFVSPDKPDTVTIIGSWIPLEHPMGGPNYNSFADDVGYYLYVDNNGDAKPDFTYRLTTKTTTKNPATFLYNTGPMTSLGSDAQNVQQTYTLEENGEVIVEGIVPPVHVGIKSTPDYVPQVFTPSIKKVSLPEGEMQVFAGQTDDPFFVDLEVFDLLTLRPQRRPIGFGSRGVDSLAGFNVHSIALQIPIAHLLKGAEDNTIIGVWSTSTRQTTKVLSAGAEETSGEEVQVSRLGMPLVNEVVIPLALKDAFNGLSPEQDAGLFTSDTDAGKLLKKSVLDPELQNLLSALYGVPHPSGDRTDLLAIFLTGMKTTKPFTIQTKNGKVELPAGFNVNQPAGVQPAEMIRLNTVIKGDLCKPRPDYQLGLLGGDACGFPNGRRLQDNVTYIELLAVAGAAYPVLTDGTFAFSPAIARALNTGVNQNDLPFSNTFPYIAAPHRGTNFRSNGGWK